MTVFDYLSKMIQCELILSLGLALFPIHFRKFYDFLLQNMLVHKTLVVHQDHIFHLSNLDIGKVRIHNDHSLTEIQTISMGNLTN